MSETLSTLFLILLNFKILKFLREFYRELKDIFNSGIILYVEFVNFCSEKDYIILVRKLNLKLLSMQFLRIK